MFDIGWGEMVVIGIVALIAIGPKELPTVLRTMGQWMGKIRRMAGEFQGQFQEAMREAEIADLKKQFDDAANSVTSAASGVTSFDPLAETRKEVESALDFHSDAGSKPAATPADASTPAATPADAQLPAETAPVTLDLPPPEPAPLDPELAPQAPQPAAEGVQQSAPSVAQPPAPQPPAAQPPAAQPPAAQPPKEPGA